METNSFQIATDIPLQDLGGELKGKFLVTTKP